MKCLRPIPLARVARELSTSPDQVSPADPHEGLMFQVRCGQCKACRIRRQAAWALRNLMENTQHLSAYFLTLTYRDEELIEKLDYAHFSGFMKRLRRQQQYSGNTTPIRFFCVGEYGSKTGRPHYHALIWGAHLSQKGLCHIAQWPHGFAFIGTVTPQSILYTTRYTLKYGQKGEEAFMRCSTKPGIGKNSLEQLGEKMARNRIEIKEQPTCLQVGGKYYPLDNTGRTYLLNGYQKMGGQLPPPQAPLITHNEYILNVILEDPISASERRREDLIFAKMVQSMEYRNATI